MTTSKNPGQTEAYKLAFACFVAGMNEEQFAQLSIPQQLDFAGGNAKLDQAELVAAVRYLGAWHEANADFLESQFAADRPAR